jgi:hypothetical protein
LSPADLGHTLAVVDERTDDVDQTKETVGSSYGYLLPLLDVRQASTDAVNVFSPVRDGLRDGLRLSSPVLDELREDLEESSHDVKESSQRRFQLKSSRSPPREAMVRLLHHRREGTAHVERHRASSSGLKSVVS